MKLNNIAEVTKWMKTTDLEEVVYNEGKNKIGLKNFYENNQEINFISESNIVNINSKEIGIFRFSKNGKDLKIEVGDYVKKDQVLGYIEVMKELKEVKSSIDGTVKIISVKDNDVVEYGQPLFFIKP